MGEKQANIRSGEKDSKEKISAKGQVCPEPSATQALCERILDGWLKMSTAISKIGRAHV